MTGGQSRGLLLVPAFCLHFILQTSLGLQMPLLESNISRNEDIYFKLREVYAKKQPPEFKSQKISFTGGATKQYNLTVDEKCKRGLPMSVRWTNYGPYASIIRPKSRSLKDGIGLAGIFPHVINRVLATCCHQDARVRDGEFISTLKSLEKNLSTKYAADMTFPVGLQSMSMTVFKDLPVVPLLEAPRTTLIRHDASEKSGKTVELFQTLSKAWPIVAFILLAAILSGIFIWILDHIKNPDEFPEGFIPGVWEGFWWAVVTMTTVGYGDRAPKSILGRLFTVIWIIIGMIIIAISISLITTALSASIQNHFLAHGSRMGAVDGSQEERIGTGMNAIVETYGTPTDVVEALVDTTNLDVIIMDNYLLSYYHEIINREAVRVQDNLEHPITYGLAFPPNSSKFTECFRRFVENNPQDIFDIIRSNLNPLTNPTDEVKEELKALEDFLSEESFHMILYCLAGISGSLFFLGIIWEYLVVRTLPGFRQAQSMTGKKQQDDRNEVKERNKSEDDTRKPKETFIQSVTGFRLAQYLTRNRDDDRQRLETIKQQSTRIRQLIQEYDKFYENWIEKLEEVTDEDLGMCAEKIANGKNPSYVMVTYNGNKE